MFSIFFFIFFSRISSLEEISSGYSSGDPLYNDNLISRGDHLVRTASLGGTSRIRTRAATKAAGLSKRSSLTEVRPSMMIIIIIFFSKALCCFLVRSSIV